jgi:hypothetical protein
VIAWTAAGMMLKVRYFFGPPLPKNYPGCVGEVAVRPEYRWLAAAKFWRAVA